MNRNTYVFAVALVAAVSGCGNTGTSTMQTTSVSAATESETTLFPATTSAPVSPPPVATPSAPDRLEDGHLTDDASDQAYWQRAVELLSEQDDVKLDPTGDVSLAIISRGETVTLFRDDLSSIAFNSCSELVDGTTPAKTVGWIKDAFGLQRRWEVGQIRLAALETKCPTLQR